MQTYTENKRAEKQAHIKGIRYRYKNIKVKSH